MQIQLCEGKYVIDILRARSFGAILAILIPV